MILKFYLENTLRGSIVIPVVNGLASDNDFLTTVIFAISTVIFSIGIVTSFISVVTISSSIFKPVVNIM